MIYRIYYKGKRKFALPIKNREELMSLRNSKENLSNLRKAQKGDQEAKALLEQLAYNIGHVDGALAGCKSQGSFFFHDIDAYGKNDNVNDNDNRSSADIKDLILSKKEELGLVMLERSASGGWHLVCKRVKGTTILENQVRVAMALMIEMDTNAHDLQRVVYSTSGSEEDLPYLDDGLFTEPMSEEECEAEYALLKERERQGREDVPKGAKKSNKHYRPWEEKQTPSVPKDISPSMGRTSVTPAIEGGGPGGGSGSGLFPSDYHGIPFVDIIRKYWEMWNEGKEPVEGDRDTLTYQLACDLRHICGRNAEWLDQVIPCYDGFPLEEKRRKIESALQAKTEGMPYRLKQVLAALRANAAIKACGGTLTTPPPMPTKLPPLIRLLTKNVPDYCKAAVASGMFAPLGVHMHGVKFRYWDNVEHEPTFMNVLIGRQSIGKGTIRTPIEYIMADIEQRDQPNRQREAEWKQKNPGAKQKKDPRPTDICIQMLIDNLTDAVFNQRVVDAHNNGQRFIYTSVDEIEGLKKVTSKGSADEVGLLIRKAFDNSKHGQERVGADSVSGIAPLRWNFNASTTPPNARKFFWKMVNDGTVSRLDVATIISAEDEDDNAPIQGIYDHQFADELKPYIDRLEAASGLIECPQAKKLSMDIRTENRDAARLYDSEAYRILSYRANVIAWLKGMVLYVAHGYKWSKEIADFVRWSEQYNLWCKMLYFGKQLEKELREEVEMQRQSGPQNLLSLLPDEFTKEQYRQMRQNQGRTGDGESTLRSWVKRGHIAYDEANGRYCKTEEYKRKYCA